MVAPQFSKLPWPYGKRGAFAIAVDDINPQSSGDQDGLDYGGNRDEGVFRHLTQFAEKHDNAKLTLFTVPSWTYRPAIPAWSLLSKLEPLVGRIVLPAPGARRLARPMKRKRSYSYEPFRIDRPEFEQWRLWIRGKVSSGNFEVAVHGLNHFSEQAPSSSREFFGLSIQACEQRLREARLIFENARVPIVNGFRPPSWEIPDSLLSALELMQFDFVAARADYNIL